MTDLELGPLASESCNIRKEGLPSFARSPRSLVRSFDLDGASNGAEGETDREGGEERRGEERRAKRSEDRRRADEAEKEEEAPLI